MKNIFFYIFLFVIAASSIKCKSKTFISTSGYEKLISVSPTLKNSDLVVYYFDGDCSMCLAKASFLDKKYKQDGHIKPLLVAKTINKEILNFNMKGISAPVFVEEHNEFEKILSINDVIILHQDRSYEKINLEQN